MKTKLSVASGIVLCLLSVSQPAGAQYAPRAVTMPPGMQAAYGPQFGQPVFAAQPVGYASSVTADTVSAPRSNIRVAVAEEDLAKPEVPKDAATCNADGTGCGVKGEAAQKACGCVDRCCCNSYSFRFYGDYLYLRARDAEVCYAVESNVGKAGAIPIQKSPIGMLDQDGGSGFRAGFGIGLTECSELALGFTHFETGTTDHIAKLGGALQQITAMTLHPATPAAATGTFEAAARHDIEMDMIDVDYRHLLWCGERSTMTGVVGVRWGRMEQFLAAVYSDALPFPDVAVATDIDFEGLGVRLGWEGETFAPSRRLMFYAKAYANFLAGEFDATYQQVSAGGAPDVDTRWEAGRIVPTFDFEIGTGYYSPCGRLRLTVGYLLSVWTNTVKTEDWIHAVQTNDFRDMGDSMTFDGLVARVEGRF